MLACATTVARTKTWPTQQCHLHRNFGLHVDSIGGFTHEVAERGKRTGAQLCEQLKAQS